ncbi:MAG: dipeptidase [Verrucomicrobiota bacterium]
MSHPAYLEEFLTFLRFQSVSTDPSYQDQVQKCAHWLQQWLQDAGLDSSLHPTEGHPVVMARGPFKPGRKTVLIYGHYDVQPPDPLDLWDSPPFDPTIKNGIITARGSADNKGQIFSHLLGLRETLQKAGDLPLNVIVMIEGEEEIGSKHLEKFLIENKSSLACDAIIVSDTMMVGPGEPSLTYAMRGIVAVEFTVQGPVRDLHSGLFGGIVANPLKIISQLISSLYLPNKRIAVEGFYEGVQPPKSWELEEWKTLPLNESYYQNLTGTPKMDAQGTELLERLWLLPTLELNGVYGGYQGPGSKTVIPSEAHAKITCRLVPGQNPEKIGEAIERHLRKHAPETVKLTLKRGHGGDAYALDPDSAMAQAAVKAMKEAFPGSHGYRVRDGATIPILSTFKKILGADSLLVGLALPDAKIHSPNETFPVSHLELGMKLNQTLLKKIQAS